MTLPFSNDVKKVRLPSLDSVFRLDNEKDHNNKAQACDDLIDALMLPEDTLDSTRVADPYIRGYWKTVVKRAMDPESSEVVTARMEDVMTAPRDILEQAKPAIEAFHSHLPITKVDKHGQTKEKVSIWDLYDEESQER
eukprot:CAMPEP_0202471608 /NCGR_PEP_ID=MMETSP1360-20130828/85259_1 /ASSEMBLY_ACC=CAM_ASM_000848 /TAXON_ID=515479 /ORGANISM="Licmophora paradoxa, Strain CCMP2313" /LENGTH=137 /DNA_ID=CAMNT_0049097781 /DNA_START=115 /DNA_END=528 /DNA_ORIENTATION=+